jgi:hypothetical protein
MDADERNALQREVDSQADHFLSDGIFPTSTQGGAHINLGRFDDYASFKLVVHDPAAWSGAISALEDELAINIEAVPFTEVDGNQGVPGDKAALLVRPDGLIEWQASSGDDLTPERVLQELRNALNTAIRADSLHQTPNNANLSKAN